jgi:hypothetical protein
MALKRTAPRPDALDLSYAIVRTGDSPAGILSAKQRGLHRVEY